jgi:uncharacterized coiled-coil DUF342 family protein
MKKFVISTVALAGVAEAKANPIRRVVTLLQEMQKEITAEVEKEKDMFEKFQCYCKKNSGSLDSKTKEAAALIKKTKAEVEGLTGQKKQLTEELKQHKADRKKAEADLKAASKKRAEEKAKFDEATKEQRKTLADLDKAITALEQGMGKAFLQTGAARYLKQVSESSAVQGLDLASQEQLNSFLQSGADYSSSSGEIVGILKMIKENIDNELGGVIGTEEAAVKAFTQMKASLEELIKTSSQSIEKKQELAGQVAVKIVEGKNKVSTTEKQLGDDLKTAAELKEACSDNVGDFETRQNDAAAEVEAIGQAIGVLNNDDALDLFKKTDTKAFTQLSLLQISSPVASALKSLNASSHKNPAVALLAFSAEQALKAKTGKVDFSKVIKMIDDMSVLLKQEAEDDLKSRDSCNESFNDSEADAKEVAHAIKGLNAEVEDAASVIDAQTNAIEKYTNDIAAAKTAMSEASAQRQKENAEFIEAVELNKEAVELIMKAKDKLNAYYNPDLVRKETITRDETGEEAAERVSSSLAQLPESAPEMWAAGDRKSQAQKGGSVLALMDTLANDLNKDTAAMEHSEQTAQRDYEKLSNDLAIQVADSSKARNEASKTKADAEGEKQTLESTLEMKSEEQADIAQTIADLHAKCDFILSAFEERKAARENEISGLQKAKAVLQGAKLG